MRSWILHVENQKVNLFCPWKQQNAGYFSCHAKIRIPAKGLHIKKPLLSVNFLPVMELQSLPQKDGQMLAQVDLKKKKSPEYTEALGSIISDYILPA